MSLELVRVLYEQNTDMPQDESYYQRALIDIEEDGISSQIYFLLKQQGRLSQTPVFFQNHLKESFNQGLFQNLLIKNHTEAILKSFEGNRVDVIPLKGVYFAEKYFGHLGARVTSDIDLLIKQEDLHKSIEIVKSMGFTNEELYIPGHFHLSLSKPLPHSSVPLVVELHWNLVREDTSSFTIKDLWEQAMPVGPSGHIKELSPAHTFYMICLHGWRHNLDSMKYFLDIIQVIYHHHQELNYESIIELAVFHQTKKRLIRTLSIVYHQFPHLAEVKSFSFEKKKSLWQYRPVKRWKLYADFVDYQFLSYDTTKHNLSELFTFVRSPK